MVRTLPLAQVSYRAYRVWQRNRDTWLRLWKTSVWPPFIEPVLNILALGVGLGFYVRDIEGVSYLQFIAPGFIASSAMFSASFECTYGTFIRMEFQKTFDAIIATPVNIEDVIMGEILWGATRSLFTSTVVLSVITAFGLAHSPWALLVPVVGLLAGLALGGLAVLVTGIVPTIDHFTYYFTLGMTPMFLFSGVFFPTQRLGKIAWASWFSPLTHVVNLQRALVLNRVHPELLWDVLWLAVFASITINLSIYLMRRRLIK